MDRTKLAQAVGEKVRAGPAELAAPAVRNPPAIDVCWHQVRVVHLPATGEIAVYRPTISVIPGPGPMSAVRSAPMPAELLDFRLRKTDEAIAAHRRLERLARRRVQAYVDQALAGVSNMVPLRYVVRYREGPGIVAADFHDSGVPLVRVSGLRTRSVSLQGCNFLDESKVRSTWGKFRLRMGDYLLSASASTGQVSIVNSDHVVGAVPYTGIIVLRPARRGIHMPYVEALLASSGFVRQIDQLKAGMGMQHFGPTHLAQIRVPWSDASEQKCIGDNYAILLQEASEISERVRRVVALLEERRLALIASAVSGQIDATTVRE